MKLENLSKIKTKKKKRIGRGYGSGKGGHTVGKGQKGQRSRSGYSEFRAWIRESKLRSLPKLRGIGKRKATRGYIKGRRKDVVVNLKDLKNLKEGSIIDKSYFKKYGFVGLKSKKQNIKILGLGDISKKVTVRGIQVSKVAKKKIEDAGGKVL